MHLLKRSAVTLLGAALLLVGVALMVLPGPGILLIVAGLAVLATEYVWARRLLVRAKRQAAAAQEAAVSSPTRTGGSIVFALSMVALGAALVLVEQYPLELLAQFGTKVWSPVTGGILVVTGLILLTTTIITLKTAKGEETTHTRGTQVEGATRLEV